MDSEAKRTFADLRRQAQEFMSRGEHQAAAQALLEARDLFPGGDAGLFAAYSLRDAGQLENACLEIQRYTRDHPTDARGWIGLGVFLRQQARYAEAVKPLRTALAIKNDVTVRNILVSSLWQLGQLDEARAEGLRNLQDKHEQALGNFSSSSFKDCRLSSAHRRFDPTRPERNIISFSLWGDKPEYVTGAIVNAQIAQHLYVHWTPRFYCDNSVPADAIQALKAYGAQVIMVLNPDFARFRPMWRFLVANDPQVNVFVCRDTDSRLNAQELLAVQDWLNSGKRFHIMRDHIYHHELIMAGMWGGTSGVLPNIEKLLLANPAYFDNPFADQAFLADMMWPLIQKDVKIHDTEYRFPDASGFPPGYALPGLIHVGGSVKQMPHWSRYVQMPRPGEGKQSSE
jgi:Flp pilus assembly protein TadD